MWGHKGFDHIDIQRASVVNKHELKIHYRNAGEPSEVSERTTTIDLSKRITIENGDLKYVDHESMSSFSIAIMVISS